MTYEELLIEADNNGLVTKEKDLQSSEGRIKGNRIAIKRDLPSTAKACALSEELGHFHTTTGTITDLKEVSNRKQERAARLWAYDKQIGLSGIIQGHRNCCRTRFELAECLGVTEEFLSEALDCYRQKYGCTVDIDGYTIFFEPSLAVMEKVLY